MHTFKYMPNSLIPKLRYFQMGVTTLPIILPITLLFFPFMLLHAQEHFPSSCPSNFQCGTNNLSVFPLYDDDTSSKCGLIEVSCNGATPKINLGWSQSRNSAVELEVSHFLSNQSANVSSPKLQDFIKSKSCDIFSYFSPLYYSPDNISYTISPNLTLFNCDTSTPKLGNQSQEFFYGNYFDYSDCPGSTIYYPHPNHTFPSSKAYPNTCKVIQLPVIEGKLISEDFFSLLGSNFTLGWEVSSNCMACHNDGSICSGNRREFHCIKDKGKNHLTVILATVIPGCILMLVMATLTLCYWKKWKDASTHLTSRNIPSNPSSKSDLEGGGFFLGISVFSYAELEEATDEFDPARELGNGGFGSVYHGKLQDGREVAVKRLYEHNYKRATQFRNEIDILTRLHHKNLVTLYGCTSGQSRELLLVYEYIPNGTVADHLHGDRANIEPLTWPIRINIAIETASALAYLHKSDIIHRDVKTNNILLDSNFVVKVADFGLSRLFPMDVTHVSTAPQGTPGYVDPEYHQCYQLTEKSDVYSFGVVLIELVSSMPAVDINRHRYEINLANLAMNKIQNKALDELIDPSLGYESDPSIERMITSVVDVAFRCLQLEKEMRPSMEEVFETLVEIRDYKDDTNMETKRTPHWPEGDHVVLLKTNSAPPSPDSVAHKWLSASDSSSSGKQVLLNTI